MSALVLSPDDLFTVTLDRDRGDYFTALFSVNGISIVPDTPFEVSFLWDIALACQSENCDIIKSTCDGASARITLTFVHPGTYRLSKPEIPAMSTETVQGRLDSAPAHSNCERHMCKHIYYNFLYPKKIEPELGVRLFPSKKMLKQSLTLLQHGSG